MAFRTEKEFLENLLSRPVYVIQAHGNASFIHSKTPRIRKTRVPDGMMVNSLTVPGEILTLSPSLLDWFLTRPESRLNTLIPLFAVHSISDLYGQESVFWNAEEVPFEKILIENKESGKRKELYTLKKRDVEEYKKIGVFRGRESQFEHPHRVLGGFETLDISFIAKDDILSGMGVELGVYEFTLDNRVNLLDFGDEFRLSDVFKKIPSNALVVLLTCSAWQLVFEGEYSSVLYMSEAELNNTRTGKQTRNLIREGEEIYHRNEVEYHSLPLITKGSPEFQMLREFCSPIYLPNLIFRQVLGQDTHNSIVGIMDPISKKNWENTLKEMRGGNQLPKITRKYKKKYRHSRTKKVLRC